MSELLPLFPLPSVVLFPGVFLPLHVFEPRYRQLVADALDTDRLIGMVLLKDGWQVDYEGQPPVYAIGCSGLITHHERLEDGRYHIILRGVDRFRIIDEDASLPYRRAHTQPLREPEVTQEGRAMLGSLRGRIEALLSPSERGSGIDPRAAEAMSDGDLINALAQYLDFEPLEKQALLEAPDLLERGRALIELLEMKLLMSRTSHSSPFSH